MKDKEKQKFKNAEEINNAYKELGKEFENRIERVKELEKKQIEEMAKDIPYLTLDREVFVGATEKRIVGWTLSEEDNKMIAKALIEQGYRKLDEDSVVLSREEYNELKQEWTRRMSTNKRNHYLEKRVSKETVEKFICWLKENVLFFELCDNGKLKGNISITLDQLENFSKQFGDFSDKFIVKAQIKEDN